VHVEIEGSAPRVLGDKDRLQQVLGNLIDNASRMTPEGGTVTIRLSAHERESVLEVLDEGPGIADEDIPRVFDRFYRAPNAARQTKGAGLGLYLAKAIVEAHGGRIWIDACGDKGARVCFSLPLNANP
jgi:signal transduction histidine kinase